MTEEDELLERIAVKSDKEEHKALDGQDYLEQTIDLLQHVACQRKGPLMRVGGNDGLRLSRAAFAVILKFSELTRILRTVWDEVELVCMGIDQDVKGPARLNHLAKELRDSKPQEFEVLCKQWEQASQIRKWTQEMKKDLSEALKKECTDQLIAEINEKMKKEKEEKEN